MFEGLEKIPWWRLTHAYGIALDAPKWIRALVSEDEDSRTEAVFYFLFSCVCHQSTLYSSASRVVPFLIEILQHPESSNLPVINDPLKMYLLEFLEVCTSGCHKSSRMGLALLAGKEVYAQFLDDENPKVREYSRVMIDFCYKSK